LLSDPNSSTGVAIFAGYERGGLPPFNSDVNAFKIGIRIQAQGWSAGVR